MNFTEKMLIASSALMLVCLSACLHLLDMVQERIEPAFFFTGYTILVGGTLGLILVTFKKKKPESVVAEVTLPRTYLEAELITRLIAEFKFTSADLSALTEETKESVLMNRKNRVEEVYQEIKQRSLETQATALLDKFLTAYFSSLEAFKTSALSEDRVKDFQAKIETEQALYKILQKVEFGTVTQLDPFFTMPLEHN